MRSNAPSRSHLVWLFTWLAFPFSVSQFSHTNCYRNVYICWYIGKYLYTEFYEMKSQAFERHEVRANALSARCVDPRKVSCESTCGGRDESMTRRDSNKLLLFWSFEYLLWELVLLFEKNIDCGDWWCHSLWFCKWLMNIVFFYHYVFGICHRKGT